MLDVIKEVLLFVFVSLRCLLIGFIGIFKAFLPRGILPRKSVEGDICLITGAGSGIGRLMAIEFAKLGCTLVLWDINEKGNEETKAMLSKSGVKVYTFTVDLSKRQEINAVSERVKGEIGNVDILINNAGIVTGMKLFDCPDELIEKTMAVNTNALIFTAKNFLKSMIDRNHGHIVTVASIAGKCGVAELVDYCASKFGAVGFHESISAEIRLHKATGVHTTVVCPYYIDTGMFHGAKTNAPHFLPMLQPEFVVDCIMDAVLTNQEELQIPQFCYQITALMGIFPSAAKHVFAEYLGINHTMQKFQGRNGIVKK